MTDEGDEVGEQPTSYGLQPPSGGLAARPAGMAGRLLAGRYRLHSRLGQGGMGTVWRAKDEVVDRDVAVKEPRLPENLSERERQTLFERMQREARAAARIDHPAVVTVHDVVLEDGKPWIVMELVRGRSLGGLLSEGTLDPREVARIGLAVLGALGAAHEAGILHRDVKPDNVLLGRYERVVLTDFGIAQIEGEQRLTETGGFVGSPEFIAPERVLGQRPGPESDLWSLGVVLYTAVEGVSPYRRLNTPATLQAVLSAEPAPPTRGAGVLGGIVMQLLRKDPAARPAATEVGRQLERLVRPVPFAPTALATAPDGAGPAASRLLSLLPHRRAPRLGVLGGALAAVLALVLLIANPLAAGGAPDGWKAYDESKQLRASLAAPAEYKRSVDEEWVTFTDPSEVHSIDIWLETGIKDSALRVANDRLEGYEEDETEGEISEVDGAVTETEYQGRNAAELIVSYSEEDADGEVEQIRERRFIYNNGNNISWTVLVSGPAKGKAEKEGERIFRDFVQQLEIKEP